MDPRTPPVGSASSAPAATMPPTGRRWWARILIGIVLVAFFAPVYFKHMMLSARGWMNDDARQHIWPLLRFYDEFLLQDDKTADYYLACMPAGFTGLYRILSAFDPRSVSKVLPYVLMAITAGAAWRAARRLRGPAAGWAALALVLGGQIYLSRITGGSARSFAFPILALMLYAIARGKAILGALVTVLAALFYPAMAVVCGLALFGWMLLPPRSRGPIESWGWGKRLGLVLATALVTAAVIFPNYQATKAWGRVLRPADAAEYPELSESGRYSYEDRSDNAFSMTAVKNFVDAPLSGLGGEWDPARSGLRTNIRAITLLILFAAGAVGFLMLARTSGPAKRILLVPIAAVIGYVVSAALAPLFYIPARYQLYPLAITAAVVVPAGLAHLTTAVFRVRDQRRAQSLALLATVGVYVAVFSAYRFEVKGGPQVSISELARAGLQPPANNADVTSFLAGLPQTAVIAGWPTDMDGVSYLTARTTLVSRENHQAFHADYADLMRKRTKAVIAALYDTDPNAPAIRRLQKEFGVTHLVVNPRLYDSAKPPRYFEPFNQDLTTARAAAGKHPPVLRSSLMRAFTQVYPAASPTTLLNSTSADDEWYVVDLSRLPSLNRPTTAPATQAPATQPGQR